MYVDIVYMYILYYILKTNSLSLNNVIVGFLLYTICGVLLKSLENGYFVTTKIYILTLRDNCDICGSKILYCLLITHHHDQIVWQELDSPLA